MRGDSLRYMPELDGLRALAALAVLFFHAQLYPFAGGYIGVDVFFVLSGYLITTILVRQHETGGVRLADFYRSRARRLYPALLAMLAVYVVAGSILLPGVDHWRGAIASAIYALDYAPTYPHGRYLLHTWSLAAEMHFYLVWPLVVIAVLSQQSKDALRRILFWIAVLGTGWSIANQLLGINAYYRMDTRIGQLAWGGWLALVHLTKPAWYTGNYPRWIGWVASGVLAGIVVYGPAMPWKVTVVAPVVAIATLAILQTAKQLPLTSPPLVWLGKMSYGIYLWHYPIIVALLGKMPAAQLAAITLAASVLLAAFSYYTVEAWFRAPTAKLRTVTEGS
jgi:peptidoglycan/LPS O-acetylase OafA/YrhL